MNTDAIIDYDLLIYWHRVSICIFDKIKWNNLISIVFLLPLLMLFLNGEHAEGGGEYWSTLYGDGLITTWCQCVNLNSMLRVRTALLPRECIRLLYGPWNRLSRRKYWSWPKADESIRKHLILCFVYPLYIHCLYFKLILSCLYFIEFAYNKRVENTLHLSLQIN